MAQEVNMLPRHRGNLLEQFQRFLLLGLAPVGPGAAEPDRQSEPDSHGVDTWGAQTISAKIRIDAIGLAKISSVHVALERRLASLMRIISR
jgi:hypothetical protein